MFLLAACGSKSSSEEDGSDAGCVPFDAGPLDTALAMQGLSIIEQRKCQTCHGETLSGNDNGVQVSGTSITQYPPNLSSDPATGLGCWTNDQIVRAILYGIDNEGAVICPPMPQWADAGMTVADATAVMTFLRTLPPVTNNVPSGPDCTCATNNDCTQGLICENLICEIGPGGLDAGQGNTGDAGTADAGDAGEADAGDAGTADAGDAGEVDAGDAGETDAGDAGEVDAGDAGEVDAGDAGEADAGDAGEVDAGDAGEADAGDAGEADAGDAGEVDAGDAGEADAGDAGEADAGDAGPSPRHHRHWRY